MTADLCVVCGSRSNTYSFGVFCCRACCAFFRRSVHKKYSCRRENNCKIDSDGLRNSCRSCRLKRCIEVGMNLKESKPISLEASSSSASSVSSSAPIAAIQSTATPSVIFPASPMAVDFGYFSPASIVQHSIYNAQQFMEPDPSRFPYINKVLSDFQTLQRSQRSLYSIENPHTIFEESEFRPISKSLFKKMEHGTMSLIHNLLSETLDFYGDIKLKAKIEVGKQISQKYGALHMCMLTSKHFTDAMDKRIATHYGYYIDPQNFNHFFDCNDSNYTDEQRARLVTPVMDIAWRTASKVREMGLRDIELAGLAAVFIWNELEDSDLMNREMCIKRDLTHRELHINIMARYGVEVGSARLIRLMSLIQDIMRLNKAYQEMLLLACILQVDDQVEALCESFNRKRSEAEVQC